MPPKYKFLENERVLCYHGPLLYEAKVIKIENKEKQVKYFVHYQGWNKSWDEWVPEVRVLKYNEANLQKQKELQETHQKNKKSKTGKKKSLESKDMTSPVVVSQEKKPKTNVTTPVTGQSPGIKEEPKEITTPSSSSTTNKEESQRKKRSRLDPHVEQEEAFANRMEIKIKIPEELKPWLVDDWDLITRQKKLVQLPARQTVDTILSDYVKQKTTAKLSPSKESAIIEVTSGIKEYFNTVLGSQLLYKFERPQYQNHYNQDKPLSSIYGAIHLLRLFVKLGSMLVYTNLDEKSIQLLLVHIHDFLKYMGRNSSLFSLNDYYVAPPEYHRRTV